MNKYCEQINDFSHLVANEVEIESQNDTTIQINSNISKTKEQNPFFVANDYLNGALHDDLGYCWSQTFTEIEIHVRLPNQIKSKQLKVTITPTEIAVTAQMDGEQRSIIGGTLSEKCKATDAMWTITGQNKLNISIDKIKEIWWKKLFLHETNQIDVGSKVDCSRPIEELSDEVQAQISKIQFDERQKMKGELTSDQLKQHEILRKAWNADGSPFKGQQFDPNIVSFEN